jgi:hypothetical protein
MERISNEQKINSDDDSSYEEKNQQNNKIIQIQKADNSNSDSESSDENKKDKIDENADDNKKEININEEKKNNLEENNIPNNIEKELIDSIQRKENVTKKNLILAEKINFKNKPEKIVETDEFGFIIKKKEGETELVKRNTLSKDELLTINARTEKWRYMIENINVYKNRKKNKLKERTRKGIPDSLRSQIWQLFADIKRYDNQKDLFENLEKEQLDQETEITIIKDLDRTFPACSLFTDKYGGGQRKLFKVLSNYSKFNKQIGYVQGMAYMVALFLIYMDEKSSFFLLHSIIKDYELEGIYLPGFPDLKKKFYVLLNLEKKFIPRVYEVLKRDGILPSLYASEWFICLFCKDLKPNVLVRIFDTFLFEKYKVIYRFALAFLKMKENDFVNGKPGIVYTMEVLKKILDDIDIEALFKVAFSFKLSKKHIAKFEQEYERNKNDKNNEFVSQL